MNIHELDSYNLGDAVKFHRRLNPRIWGRDEHLLAQVRERLLAIAADFQEFLGVEDLDVQDITISGSNAAYSYTKNSDIDLHLVVEMPADPVYQELFSAKKYQYNSEHNIKIGGADVELYVQPADQAHHSLGIYSVKNGDWISIPQRKRAHIDDVCVRDKVADLDARIHDAVRSGDESKIATLATKIKAMRQAGLEQQGEFGCENLAFKILRNNGCIKLLLDARRAAQDRELSLREAPVKKFRYGFGEGHQGQPYSSEDGVAASTKQFLEDSTDHSIVQDFILHVTTELGIDPVPKIHLHKDPDWSEQNQSFGRYDSESHTLNVSMPNRHVMDVLRTVAHELVHCEQNQQHGSLPLDAGETGSRWENDANARAGVIMRDWANSHPEHFDLPVLDEGASGYIPKNKREAMMPQYAMALSVDIKPGEVGRQANKLGLKTGGNGEPGLLMPTVNLRENSDASADHTAVEQLRTALEAEKTKLQAANKDQLYHMIDKIMTGIARKHSISGGTLHDRWVAKYQTTPDAWIKSAAEDLLREFEEFSQEQDELFEITMSPSSLKKLSAQTGALAGMEFEMIVPGAGGDDDGDQEPDYDQDERCRSIQDARDFFNDGDYNSRRDAERLSDEMQNDYAEWLYEKLDTDFTNESEYLISEWISNNVDESEWNPNELEGTARQEALDEFIANVDADPSSDLYQQALDEYREEYQDSYDESDWLDAEDLDLMSGVENRYAINWPHWRNTGSEEVSIAEVADSFQTAIGRVTQASSSYHSGRVSRPSTRNLQYIVEPDASLDPDDSDDQGLEFVSPPLPIEELLSDLNKVKAWADRTGCYTNDSTGLHINVSVPGWTQGTDQLDYVKLALLLGDEFVLDSFGRAGNTYAKSAMGKIRDAVRKSPDRAQELLDKIKSGMDQLASKVVHSRSTEKYTSINVKNGYIEFRSPGGDWLNDKFPEIENTLRRFTVALSAAVDPAAYRQEYLKKLYKLLDVSGDKDPLAYFAKYAAGELPRAALKSFVRQAQLERGVRRGKEPPAPVPSESSTGNWGVWVPALDKFSTMNVDGQSVPRRFANRAGAQAWIEDYNTRNSGSELELVAREIETAAAQEPQGVDTRVDYELYSRASGAVIDTFLARNDDEAITRLTDYIRLGAGQSSPDNFDVRRAGRAPIAGSTIDLQRQRAAASADAARGGVIDVAPQPAPPPAGGEFTGNWLIRAEDGTVLHRFGGIGNSQADANRTAQAWAQRNPDLMRRYSLGLDVVPEMMEGVTEARKNSEQNTKYQSGWAELAAWARKNNVWLKPHEWAISMTYLPKLGINPGPGISEDTPRGIYFYPFQWAYSVKMDKEALPWADNAPYIQLFQYSTGTELHDPNQIALASVVAQLKNYGITDEDIAAEKANYPGISTYSLLVWCLGRKYNDNRRVSILNKILRNLGYDYMIDNGKGWIAINEPTQGVVLNPKIIDKVVTFSNYTRKKEQDMAEGLTETRNSLFAFVKQQFPTWPDYVLKDFLYAQAKGIRDQAELDDFLKRNKQDFGNCKWTLTKLPITFDIFTPKTQRMLASREGGSSNPFQVPRDAERHAQQSQMIQQKGVSAEPIIVAKLSNGYDLIEGWHRTIQHLKAFPQGYTGPAWVCTGATYKSERVEQDMAENFADGKNPQDKGDSARHGIPKKASLEQLDKIGRGSGRKAQLARWQANMRRGRAK